MTEPNPNMTYEELQKQVSEIVNDMYQLGRGQTVDLHHDYATPELSGTSRLIQLFATLCAEVIGRNEDDPDRNPRWQTYRNELRYDQREKLAQLTTKNTEEKT